MKTVEIRIHPPIDEVLGEDTHVHLTRLVAEKSPHFCSRGHLAVHRLKCQHERAGDMLPDEEGAEAYFVRKKLFFLS